MIDAPSILAGLVIGSGLGSIAMGWMASGKIADWRERWNDERELAKDYRHDASAFEALVREQGRVIAEFRAARHRSNAPLKAANAKRSAEAQASRHLRMDVAEKRLAMREAAE